MKQICLLVLASCLSAVSWTVFASAEKTPTRSIPSPDLQRFVSSGITVTATPFVGTFSKQGDAEILYNLPSINEDLVLLKQRDHLYEKLAEQGLSLDHPVIGISGALVAGATHVSTYALGAGSGDGSVNLSTAELDIGALINSWATAYFSLDYDSSSASSGSRGESSNLYLQRGFLTVGDLSRTPFYVSAGQMYAPFGLYRSTMLTTPLTKSMGRVLQRMILVGYNSGSASLSLYGYHSGLLGQDSAPFNQGGVNFLYRRSFASTNVRISLGAITNIADSQGMMSNRLPVVNSVGDPQFTGFSGIEGTEKLAHAVPGVAVDLIADWRHWSVITGYVGSTRHFAATDLTFNGQGACPGAMHLELDYVSRLYAKPITVGLAYGHTWQALGLSLPEQSISLVTSMSPWKNIAVGLEYRHRINYKNATATGHVTTGSMVSVADVEAGGSQDGFTLQVGVYF